MSPRWPSRVSLVSSSKVSVTSTFRRAWERIMQEHCHCHPVWQSPFTLALASPDTTEAERFELAATWATNMVVGSYCFPRYVAALAARSEQDAIRHGLLENAWDESGSHGHTCRSHFWLAVNLARLLGLSDDNIERIEPLPEAQHYTDEHYRQCAEGEWPFAMGMICLIEEFTTPEFTLIFKALLSSCKEGLGMDPDDFVLKGGAEYFTANIADDARHREEMPELVATWLSTRGVDLNDKIAVTTALGEIAAGVQHSADLRLEFFSGVYAYVKAGGTYCQLAT